MTEIIYKNATHIVEGKLDDVIKNLTNIKKSLTKDGYENFSIYLSAKEGSRGNIYISVEIYGGKKKSFIKKLLKIN